MTTASYAKKLKDSLLSGEIKKKCCQKVFDLSLNLLDVDESQQKLIDITGKCKCTSCASFIIRALFLSFGNITDPSKAYHLEFTFHSSAFADSVEEILESEGLPAKRTIRKGKYILYFKSISQIEDVLAFIGANSATFDLLNGSIMKEMRNNINRQVNCDTNNIQRAIDSASGQIEKLQNLVQSGRVDSLPQELRETVNLRLQNPQASVAELAALHNPPISKSGCFHRLSKAIEIAKDS